MNDPNGLAYRDGRLHVFFQYDPDRPRWGRMRWGHASTSDLLSWEPAPIALEPTDDGPDRLGCWSGCLVTDDSGVPTIFYTGVARDKGVRRATICSATGTPDLTTWTKGAGDPIIARPPSGIRPDRFRDPFVWRDTDGWAMLVGAGTNKARGTVLLYRSDDLREWRYAGPFLTTDDVVGSQIDVPIDDIDSPCWECPQLVRFDDLDVLIVSVVDRAPRIRPAHVVAFTGRVSDGRFLVSGAERLGLGPDFYAPATLTAPDGRRMLLGWVPEDPPAKGSPRTWAGSLTMPRVLSVDDDGSLRLTLAHELADAAGPATSLPDVRIEDGERWARTFDGRHFELRLNVLPDGAASIRFDVAGDAGRVAEIRFDPRERRLTVARTGRVMVAGRDPHGTTIMPPTPDGGMMLRLILDGSILELVADDRVTATARLPDIGGDGRTISCTPIGGACRLSAMELAAYGGPTPDWVAV
jgi:beta-fructofuranosidase